MWWLTPAINHLFLRRCLPPFALLMWQFRSTHSSSLSFMLPPSFLDRCLPLLPCSFPSNSPPHFPHLMLLASRSTSWKVASELPWTCVDVWRYSRGLIWSPFDPSQLDIDPLEVLKNEVANMTQLFRGDTTAATNNGSHENTDSTTNGNADATEDKESKQQLFGFARPNSLDMTIGEWLLRLLKCIEFFMSFGWLFFMSW